MWKKLRDGYCLLYEPQRNKAVHITDYIKIWTIRFSDKDFLFILKTSNPGLTIDENDLLQKGKQMLTSPEGLKSVKCEEEFAEKLLNVTMIMSFGYPLKLKLKLRQDHPEMFFMKVTLPLLRVIQDLRTSEDELRQLLVKKDKEIEEYKSEGGEIALRSLKTVPFNDEAHMSKHTAYSDQYAIAHAEDLSQPEASEEMKEEENETNGSANEVKSESTVTPVKDEVKREPSSTESKSHSVKSESHSVESESNSIKSEPVSIKTETLTEPQVRVAASPNKKRRKLNL